MPRIYLLARPQFTGAHEALLRDILPPGEAIWHEREGVTPAERLVEFAGRVCYLSFGNAQSGRTNAEYIGNLLRNGHDSVLEHAAWTFALSGVSRAFTHQLVRHRIGFSFSQLSQQYHDETEAKFVRPAEIAGVPASLAIWERTVAQIQAAYRELAAELRRAEGEEPDREARRALRSAARSILPNATETVIVVTANARAVRHFLSLRGAIQGDSEMRSVSALLLDALRPEAPALFADFVTDYPEDGLPLVRRLAIDSAPSHPKK
jgi:thymidylate synthase (FAD)